MAANKERFTARTHTLPDGTLIVIELREGKVYGPQVHEWQAWCLVARPRSAAGKETLVRGGSRESLQQWANALDEAQLTALAEAS